MIPPFFTTFLKYIAFKYISQVNRTIFCGSRRLTISQPCFKNRSTKSLPEMPW
ncbi:hypothetical protein HMPREF0239_02204, partial [Clostridium sp. ATCC BAA-442]